MKVLSYFGYIIVMIDFVKQKKVLLVQACENDNFVKFSQKVPDSRQVAIY